MPENLSSDKINVVFWEEWCFSCPQKIMKLLKDGLFVNYDEKDLGLLSAEGILHWGEYQTYLISQPSWVDKYSLRYVNCLGMIASWRTFSWEIYSLLSHQDTEVMLKNSYREKVKKRSCWTAGFFEAINDWGKYWCRCVLRKSVPRFWEGSD